MTGKGAAEKTVTELSNQNVSIPLDENAIVRWGLLQQQAILNLITALRFLICSAVLLRTANRCEKQNGEQERQTLLLSGLTRQQLGAIPTVRILFVYAWTLAAGFLPAWIMGVLTLTGGAAVILALCIHFPFVRTI